MKKAMFQNALFGLTSFMMLRQQKIFRWRKKGQSSIHKVANDSLIKAAKRKMQLQEQNTPTQTINTYIVQYNLSRYCRDAFEALVDRRAHGGIAATHKLHLISIELCSKVVCMQWVLIL